MVRRETRRNYFDAVSAFHRILPKNISALEIVSISDDDLEYGWYDGSTITSTFYIDRDSFFRAQTVFAAECDKMAARHLKEPEKIRSEARQDLTSYAQRGTAGGVREYVFNTAR
jgi:hypothetical protein